MKMWFGRRLSSVRYLLGARGLWFLIPRLAMELQIAFAARAKRDRRAVGTSSGMTEEGADFVGRLGRENVLELAGLLLDLRFAVESQAVGEQALGQAVAANDVGRPQSAARSKFHDQAAI